MIEQVVFTIELLQVSVVVAIAEAKSARVGNIFPFILP